MENSNPDEIQPVETELEKVTRRKAVRRLLRAETMYAFALVCLFVLALFAYYYSYFGWDLRVARAIQAVNFRGSADFMNAVSFIGNSWHPHLLTVITVIALLAFRLRTEAAGLALSAGGSALLNNLFKLAIARPRPASDLVTVLRIVDGQSFPSGHVTFYVCYFGFLIFVVLALLPRGNTVRKVLLVLLAIPIALVGLSRVYLGAHWPSDTIGGYLFSGLWLALAVEIYRRGKQERGG